MKQLINLTEFRIPSKADIKEAAGELVTRYEEGGVSVNPLREYIVLKALEAYIKEALPIVQPWATQDAKNYSDSERKNLYGVQVQIKAGAVEYDYTGCPDVLAAQAAVDSLTVALKDAKEELKSAQSLAVKMQMAAVTDQQPDSLAIRF